MSSEEVGWCLVVPVKRLVAAKTRLGPPYAALRQELALAFALDTTAAALAAPAVRAVVAVTDDVEAARLLAGLGAYVVADEPDAGLNPALRHGAQVAAELSPGCGIGALSADLPALRPDELGHALARAVGLDSAFVRDARGDGTTLAVAGPGSGLRPAFGPDSARRHLAAGYLEITGPAMSSLRRDVDTAQDLRAATALGLGARTQAVLARLG